MCSRRRFDSRTKKIIETKIYKIKKAEWDIKVPKYKTIGKEWLKSQV